MVRDPDIANDISDVSICLATHPGNPGNGGYAAFGRIVTHLEALEKERVLGPDYHVYEARPDGWSLQHPLRCREAMLDCKLHRAASVLDEPPVKPGRYRAELTASGGISFDPLAGKVAE